MKFGKRRNFKQLNAEAKQALSSFNGNSEYEAAMTGSGKFQMPKNPKSFTITVTNENAATKTLRIMPGINYNPETPANGVMRTAANLSEFASVDGTASVFECAGSPTTPEKLIEFLRHNPTRLAGIKIKSTDATQLEERFSIKKESPFKPEDGARSINIADYVNENSFNDKVATVPVNEQLDDQTVLDLDIVAGATVTLTLYFGDVLNNAAALDAASK